MAKQLMQQTKLDRQVERYLSEPVTLNHIRNYTLSRDHTGLTVMTLEIFVDAKRFDVIQEEV